MNTEARVTIAAALSAAERAAVIDARQVVTVVPEREPQRELLADPQPDTPLQTASAHDDSPLAEPAEPVDEPVPEVAAEPAPDPLPVAVPEPPPEAVETAAS